MKQKLAPNAELDILTQDELAQTLKVAIAELQSGFSRPAETRRDFNTTLLDGSGNSGIPGAVGNPNPVPVFEFPMGHTFALHRLTVQFEGVTFGTKYMGGFIYLMRAGRVVDFADLSLGVPAVFEYTSDAPEYTAPETLDLLVSGGAADTVVICDLQGTLETLPGQLVFT